MEDLKKQLIRTARDKYKTIIPYQSSSDLHDGFSIVGNVLLFWFDTIDNSSHLVSVKFN